jgi:hypothetical protein
MECETNLGSLVESVKFQLENEDVPWMSLVQSRFDGAASSLPAEYETSENWKPKYFTECLQVGQATYPPINDNTEGVAAFYDLPASLFTNVTSVVNIGCGTSDAPIRWVLKNHPAVLTALSMDPFHRSADHNLSTQKVILDMHGVDMATSMSVLNIIPTREDRIRHISVMHRALKRGGLAVWKVWAGSWPHRGSGVATFDVDRGVFQANKWAHEFLPEVAAVFPAACSVADNNWNMIIARKDAQ